jgi:hypothetical protein
METDVFFQSPFYLSPGVPSKQSLLIQLRYFPLSVPSKGALPPWSPIGVPVDRDTPFPEPKFYSFILISQESPVKEFCHEMGGIIRSPSTEPHPDGRPTYSGVQTGSPRGSFTTLQSLPQPSARVLPPWLG